MQKNPRTIYKAARIATESTQEVAAEQLHVSVESLRAYERGVTIPPDDVVLAMVELYQTTWLAILHLTTTSKVAARFLPHIELRDLATSVLVLQKEISDVGSVSGTIVEVTCDGCIDVAEESKWQRAKKEVSEMIAAGIAFLIAPVHKEKTAHMMRAVK